MANLTCGYYGVNLIRKPIKGLSSNSNDTTLMKLQKLGNFNLIPNDGYYNIENQIFPRDTDLQSIFNTSGDISGYSSRWKIYTISDPEVGLLLPHIIKQTYNNFIIQYKNLDLDSLFNKPDIVSALSTYRNEVNNVNTDKISISEFIFEQPIFLRITSSNGSSYSWYVYIPSYKVNDDDTFFRLKPFTTFNQSFSENDSLEINDVVISNKPIEDVRFSQFGIGNNGISLKNGLSYTISDTGDVNFNVGRIKSDVTPFMKVRLKLDGSSTPTLFDKKLDSDSFVKGDVLSGTSISSLLVSTLKSVYGESVFDLTYDTNSNLLFTPLTQPGITSTGISVYLQNSVSTGNDKIYLNFAYSFLGNNSGNVNQKSIYYGNTTVSSLSAGYYKVTPIKNNVGNITGWKFTADPVYSKIKMLSNKLSKFDFLIVKK